MTWHVQFAVSGGPTLVEQFPTPESAIEKACALLDRGYDVFGIGTGPLSDSIDRLQIRRIYELWKRSHP